ncbi:MAG: hypothetical protein IPJ19_09295 [Planctomycetes bacterium]|nr:hypothetical protein [Planctomycetota bacterium]
MISPLRRLVSCSLLLALGACHGEEPAPSSAAPALARPPAQQPALAQASVEPSEIVTQALARASSERGTGTADVQSAHSDRPARAARKLPAPTLVQAPIDTRALGARGLLHWFPEDALLVLRLPHVESLAEFARRTTLGRLFQDPAALLALGAQEGPLGELAAKVHDEAPELEPLLAKLPQLKGELVLGLVRVGAPDPARADPAPRVTFAFAFDAGAAADELQPLLDPLLARLERENPSETAAPHEGWGLRGWSGESCFEVRRFGNVFTAHFGSDPDFAGALRPAGAGASFASSALVVSSVDLDAQGRGALELYVHADPLWKLLSELPQKPGLETLGKLGLQGVHGLSFAFGLGPRGVAEAHTWCAPEHADIVSRVFASQPAQRDLARWIPADSATAALNFFDLRELYSAIVALLPDEERTEMLTGLEQLRSRTRIDLVTDVFENFGPGFALVARGDPAEWAEHSASLCLVLQTHDDDKVGELIGRLTPLLPPALKRRSAEFAGRALLVYDLAPLGLPAQSLCVARVDGALLLATDQRLLESCLLAGKQPGTKQAELAAALEGDDVIGATLTAWAGGLAPTLTVLRKTQRGLELGADDGSASAGAGLMMVAPIAGSIAIPKLMAARLDANQAAAEANMRCITLSQAQIQISGAVDIDRDGSGEYGTLGELCGTIKLRGDDEALDPAILALGNVEDGVATRSGYHFLVYLPARSGGGFVEAKAQDGGDVLPNQAEMHYIACGWPVDAGATGTRIYFVDEAGFTLACANAGGRYSGLGQRPSWDAYLPAKQGVDRSNGLAYTGRDGLTWQRLPDPRR